MQKQEEIVNFSEICIVGRSNVGKSSLINALTGQEIAKTSKAPGKTDKLHFITLPKLEANLVDSPGYGYADKSANMKADWRKLMTRYLTDAPK